MNNTRPKFVETINLGRGQISAANTLRDGTGTTVLIFTAGAYGARIEEILFKATGNTTQGMVRAFHDDLASKYLLKEATIDAITASGTVATYSTSMLFPDGFRLNPGEKLYASTHNAETFNVFVQGGNYNE